MKKILTRFQYLFCIIYFVINAGTSSAQMVYVPDANFRARLITLGYGSCMTGDSIDASCPMVVNATSLYVSSSGISDLSGIEAFTSLTTLNCDFNNLTTLPPLPNTLSTFFCRGNQITSLPALPATLDNLFCANNQITVLPALPASLLAFSCGGNPITVLPSLPATLGQLECGSCQLTSLPVLPNSLYSLNCPSNQINSITNFPNSLTDINVADNLLTSLPALPNSLTTVNVAQNLLTSLPALPNSLTTLYCGSNQLVSLPALPGSLITFDCSYNQLTFVPALPASLVSLYCQNNILTSLPALANSLTILACNSNQLTSLPALPNSLQKLYCNYNSLTTLPALSNSLIQLQCYANQLTSLPALPNSLRQLICNDNDLTSLPALPNLNTLYCYRNYLTGLPVLPDSLRTLDCSYNSLTTIPPLPDTLYTLYCGNNQLTSLPELTDSLFGLLCQNNPNLHCLPQLNWIHYLNFSGTAVTCLPNYGNVVTSTPPLNGFPLCGLFNPDGCQFFWNISGKSYFDANINCADDNGDILQQNINLKLYQGNVLLQQTLTGGEGYYSFDTDTLGIYETRLDTAGIPFDVLCPVSQNYTDTLTANDTLRYDRNFALKCKNGFDLGVWSIASHVFRPTRFSTVNINAGDIANFYGVHCASGVSGSVQVVLTGAVSYSSPAPGATAPSSVNGDTLLWNIPDFGTTDLFTHFNIIVQTDTNALINSQVCFDVTVTANSPGDYNPANATLSHCFTVVGSYDPNDKVVYPSGYVDINGAHWLTYTIHFQNTGTAPAQHIYITDTLDASLDLSTFQLLAYSHQPHVQILEGGIARFNFPNINLPDSNSNEPASHGFIQYKIKFLSGLPAGTQIQNTAYIYFDFNPPVVTNTTLNIIYAFPSVSVSGNTAVCIGNCSNISALVSDGIPPYTYSWTPNVGAGSGPYLVCPNLTTTYSVIISDVNNVTSSSSITVTVNPLPIASVTPSGPITFCQGDSVTLTSSAASSYLWSDNSTAQSINVTSSGNYVVTATDANNCTASSAVVLVIVNPLPNASITPGGPTTFCQGNSVTLTSSAASSYLWSDNSATQSINVTSSGNYVVTVTDVNNCSSASPATTVTVNPNPAAPSISQSGDSLTSDLASGYQWYFNSVLIPGATSQSYHPLQNGNYSVVITDVNNCTASSIDYPWVLTETGNFINDDGVIIYPNPTVNELTVQSWKFGSMNEITILNLLGEVLLSKNPEARSKQQVIDVSALPNGVYLVEVRNENQISRRKFMKM